MSRPDTDAAAFPMLSDSVLGRIYRLWLQSWLCALLGRAWHWLSRLARESAILRCAFGPARLDARLEDSALFWLLCAPLRALLRLLRPLVRGMRESLICAWVGKLSRESLLLHFDLLFSAFCCAMFVIPHEAWNNLYAVAAALVFFAAHLLLSAGDARGFVFPDRLGLGFMLFALSCVLSLLFTRDRGASLRILLFFFAAFLLCYLVAFRFDNRRSLRLLLGFLYLSLVLVSCMAIAQRALHLVSVNSSYTDTRINAGVPARVFGSLDNPANLSGFIQMFLPLSTAWALGTEKGWKRVIFCLGLGIPAVAMVMTYARAGWISVLISALVLVYFADRKLIPLLLAAGICCVPFLPQSILIRLSTIGNSMDSSAVHRLALWTGVLNLLKDYGLGGIGLGPSTFSLVYPIYAEQGAITGAYHSQMMYMELMLEMGLLGLLSFLWTMLKYAGRAGRAIGRGTDWSLRLLLGAFLGALAGLAFAGLFEYLWFYPRSLFAFFLFFGVAIAAMRCAEREQGLLRD